MKPTRNNIVISPLLKRISKNRYKLFLQKYHYDNNNHAKLKRSPKTLDKLAGKFIVDKELNQFQSDLLKSVRDMKTSKAVHSTTVPHPVVLIEESRQAAIPVFTAAPTET
ncbi:hypothetical protein [Collimonas fungivorans]|uniref:hypothetical protein n=1 Tax=Collimonas fungivorans TaxID=158899 RepID=UPI003FA37C0D